MTSQFFFRIGRGFHAATFIKTIEKEILESLMKDSEKCQKAKSIIQEWADKQGHDRCWYYPELFIQLTELFEVKPAVQPCLPPRAEFEEGCRKFQTEEYQ